jgi:hypothetical protein
VAVFPEGAVTDGTRLLPFKGSLLQPIIESAGCVQPVAIRYRTRTGDISRAPAYDDVTFLHSFWRICGERTIVADIVATPPLPAAATHRRALAADAEAVIRAVLALPAHDSAPGRCADRKGESP